MMDRIRKRCPALLYGGDYNFEQWPESVWHEDMKRLKDCGVNCLTIGVFGWAKLNPRPGEFVFDWLDKGFDLIEANGIWVDLATATASPPAWLAHAYPEVRPVMRDGTVLYHGSRQAYTPNSHAYREHAGSLVERLAERYGKRNKLLFWHVNNELGCHLQDGSFGVADAKAWREWLQQKYGSLASLNETWGTAFWSQTYGDWGEVLPPLATNTLINPTMQLDWERFWSDVWQQQYAFEAAILKAHTPEIPITTNLMPGRQQPNSFQLGAALDFVATDIYPNPQPDAGDSAAFPADLSRGYAGGKPWLLMEQAPNFLNRQAPNTAKAPGLLRLWTLQTIGRGADGALFFQIRQSRRGAEKFHSGLIPNTDPEETRSYREARDLGRELARLSPVLGTRSVARIALLACPESEWVMAQAGRTGQSDTHYDYLREYHEACLAENIPVDIIHPEADLSPYRLVFAPALHMVSEERGRHLERFVSNGGIFISSFLSGVVDQDDALVPGGAPGHLRRLMGLWVEEWDPAMPGRENAIKLPEGNLVPTHQFAEVIHLESARSIGNFAEGYYAGKPALTLNFFGKGRAYYVACRPKFKFLRTALRTLVKNNGIGPVLEAPEGVEIQERRAENGGRFIFILNRNPSSRTVNLQGLTGRDLLSGRMLKGSVMLEKLGAVVFAPDPSTAE